MGMRPGPTTAGAVDHLVGGGVVDPVVGRLGHALRGEDGRARRGVDLRAVVQLDDLGRLEVGRRHLGEAHHQHGADGEVGGHDAVALGELLAQPVVVLLARSPWCRPRRAPRWRPASPGSSWRPGAPVKSMATSTSSASRLSALGPTWMASRLWSRVTSRRSNPAWWGSMAATRFRSGSAATAAQTVAPIRPPAPKTATRRVMASDPTSRRRLPARPTPGSDRRPGGRPRPPPGGHRAHARPRRPRPRPSRPAARRRPRRWRMTRPSALIRLPVRPRRLPVSSRPSTSEPVR